MPLRADIIDSDAMRYCCGWQHVAAIAAIHIFTDATRAGVHVVFHAYRHCRHAD